MTDQQRNTWFISRHAGAIDWAKRQSLHITRWVAHLDPNLIQSGDTVIGTLPVSLAAAVCDRGARYFHLTTNTPAELRGHELTAEELDANGASLEEYIVKGRP